MFFRALFDPFSLLVLIVIAGMVGVALVWYRLGQQHLLELVGGLKTLRRFARDLFPSHPVRRRLESAPVVELSLEEISKIMSGDEEVEPASQGLIRLQDRLAWIERFSQYAIHIGILGTVFALVTSDPTDMASFRARLPLALGTTFWGLVGALVLSTLAGMAESVLDRARHAVRRALLDAIDRAPDAPPLPVPSVSLVLAAPPAEEGASLAAPTPVSASGRPGSRPDFSAMLPGLRPPRRPVPPAGGDDASAESEAAPEVVADSPEASPEHAAAPEVVADSPEASPEVSRAAEERQLS